MEVVGQGKEEKEKPPPSEVSILPGGTAQPSQNTSGQNQGQPPDQETPKCPKSFLRCPNSVTEGESITFTATNAGLSYKWSVTAGTITKGQGTNSISVDTTGLGGQTLTAIPIATNIDRRCGNIFPEGNRQCSVQILKPQPPEPTYGDLIGRVEYTDGTGVPAITVRATNRKTGSLNEAVTDGAGWFVIKNLPVGTYYVSLPNSPFDSGSPSRDSGSLEVNPRSRSTITLVGKKPPPPPTPEPKISPTVSPSPVISPSPILSPSPGVSPSPDITPAISPSVTATPGPASVLEPGAAGTIKVSWPSDLSKNWRGTISVNYIPPRGGRPRDLVAGYTASADIRFDKSGLRELSSRTGEQPLDDSAHEWLATVEPEENAGSEANCVVMIELKLKNRETGETTIVRRKLAEANLTVSTAPVSRNQAITLSASFGVLGLGLVGFGSVKRRRRVGDEPARKGYGASEWVSNWLKGMAERSDRAARPPEAGGMETETPQYKQISAWITEREQEPQRPLRLNESYTLNFKVGQQTVAASLLRGPEARVPETDIPEEGLDTEWIVVSRSVQLWKLPSAADNLSVTSKMINNRSAWTAKFSLHIPKQGESEIVLLGVTPLDAERTGLDIYIYVDGELYRQLELKFIVQEEDEIESVLAGTDGEPSHART
ncbi:MAG TPA: carboxypeptidase regulatory-like domain-containing protein [Pyrinomonadaceae bacterium]